MMISLIDRVEKLTGTGKNSGSKKPTDGKLLAQDHGAFSRAAAFQRQRGQAHIC
jgi:hypothetical protein